MKRFTQLALMLCILMMCATPQMVQGQNRRSGGPSSGPRRENVQRSAQRTRSSSSERKQTAQVQRQSQPQHSQARPQQRQQPQARPQQRQQPQARPQQRQQPQARQVQPQRRTTPVPRREQPGRYDNRGVRPAPRPAPHNPGHYRPAPPRPAPASIYHYGYRATVLPYGAYRRVYRGIDYYYCNNVFYRHHNGVYVVCRPPIGATFAHAVIGAALTTLIIRGALDNSRYYYNNGVYYTRRNDRYTVVEAPVGGLVSQLPDGYEEVVIDGTTYYQVDNVLYKTTVYSGLPYFEVAAIL